MFAVVETGGKQYRVAEGDVIYVEKLDGAEGDAMVLDRILLVSDGESVKVGTPFVQGAQVMAKVEKHGRSRKIIVYKYKPKKNYRRKAGHRQPYTRLLIEKIEA